MLLPDTIHPEQSLYYNGALVLQELKLNNQQRIFDLYQKIKETTDMSFVLFSLSLDWLYLINMIGINEEGSIQLCLSNQ